MTLLVISPDYASHLLPLATLATAWAERGERVVVVTGPATAGIVAAHGFEHIELPLGRGSNAGVIRPGEQPADEGASLRGFFAATRKGMVATLAYQARERLTDLMWEPVDRARRVRRIVDELSPDAVLVDHLAYSARLGLEAAGARYGDVVLGHPTALPVGDEVYGYPTSWPEDIHPDAGELAELHALCTRVAQGFTGQWNLAAHEVGAPRAHDAFAAHGAPVLYNYPAALTADDGRALPPHVFLGSAVRRDPLPDDLRAWAEEAEPFVYVSFGSFLSARGEVLARVAEALRRLRVRAAIAHGSTPAGELGPLPSTWVVRETLPQVGLLAHARAAVTHGGNNSITETVAAGVPSLVLPFSTDQFAGAAAIERSGAGLARDPQKATIDELTAAIGVLLGDDGARARAATVAASDAGRSGPERAYAALTGA